MAYLMPIIKTVPGDPSPCTSIYGITVSSLEEIHCVIMAALNKLNPYPNLELAALFIDVAVATGATATVITMEHPALR